MDMEHLAHAWEARFENSLEAVLSNQDSKIDDLIDVIWNMGILDRLVPQDKAEHLARINTGRDVFDSRDNPELYLRIIYSILYAKWALASNFSAITNGFAAGAFARGIFMASYRDRVRDFFPEYNGRNYHNAFNFVADMIIERAKEKMRELGVDPPVRYIKIGERGMFEGIPIRIERYMAEGLLYVRPESESVDDLMRFFDITKRDIGVSPSRLNPENFC